MKALDDLELDSPPFSPLARAASTHSFDLAEAKRALVGVRLICATVDGDGERPFLANAYEVVNVTRDAVILVYRRQDGSSSSRFSIQIATGRSKHETSPGYFAALHPTQAARLRGLLGADPVPARNATPQASEEKSK